MEEELIGLDDRTPAHDSRGGPVARPVSPPGHRLMFFALSSIAFLLFAPTIVLPLLQQHGQLMGEEAHLRQRVVELQDEVRRRAELEEAFQRDAVVNERLAVLDLGYRRPNEEVMTVLNEERVIAEQAASAGLGAVTDGPILLPAEWPAWIHQTIRWGQRRGLVDVFLDPDLRAVLLLMSAGLVVASFVLFAPRVPVAPGGGVHARWAVAAPRTAE